MAFNQKSASTRQRQGINPMVAGIIIGLLLGIFLALGVALWLNSTRASNFVEKTKPSEQLTPMKTATASLPKTDPADPNKQRFDFYQILPGEKSSNNAKAANVSTTPNTPDTIAKDPTKDMAPDRTAASPFAVSAPAMPITPIAPIKSLDETLFLQAGAFQSEADADNMKAKIAFAGFEAAVKPVNLVGKGTLYRVRLGPYKSQDEVNRIKNVLSQNGIGAAVVKPE